MGASRYKLGAFRVRPATDRDRDAVKALVFTVLAEYGLQADPAGTDADLEDLEATYAERGGGFEVVEDPNGRLVGTAGLYSAGRRNFELRAMYLAPSVRGRGLGKWLLARGVEAARQRHARRIRLETASVLTEANALYRSFGFRPITAARRAARCDQTYELVIGSPPATTPRRRSPPRSRPRPRHPTVARSKRKPRPKPRPK